ncbi:hypothetical protein P3T39_002371 [Kitasatospora sp. GP82]|nr:hypothetical protein [Kitasatospora sp. GP82]
MAVDGHGSVVGIRLSGEFARVDVCRRSVMAL